MSELHNEKQLSVKSEQNLNLGFMVADTLDKAIKIAEIISTSGVCPTVYKGKAADVLVAMQLGAELGLKPMQALQNVAVVNGRPSVWGDAMLAICRQSPEFEYIKERYDDSAIAYTCTIKRRNEPEFVSTFSQSDAMKANLWGKQGPWTQYPKRMLQMRARGFCLRDAFPDLLRGIITQEEAADIPPSEHDDAHVIDGEAITIVPEKNTVSDEQIEILKNKISQSETDEKEFLKYANVENFTDIQSSAWGNLVRILDTKIKRKIQSNNIKDLVNNKAAPIEPDETNEVAEFFAEAEETKE